MIRFKLLLFLFLLITCGQSVNAQKSTINFQQLNSELHQLINNYRDSIGLPRLKTNTILEQAAKDQADYNNWQNVLGHDQVTYNKQSPSERVFFYNGNFNYIGENVAFVIANIAADTLKDETTLAQELFTAWINSPPHRENIATTQYYQAGLGFSYNSTTGKLYATQVFSAKGYTFPTRYETPRRAYGVQHYAKEPCQGLKNFRYGTLSFANGIYTIGDSIFIRYHDINYFNEVISSPNDGYAVDIVFRDQFPCGAFNLLHGSEIFDGYLLPPVFRYEILARNKSKNPKKLDSFLGILPKNLPPHELNLMLVNNNHKCDYSYPVITPSADIPPFFIEPLLVDVQAEFVPFKIDTTIEIPFYFKRSSASFSTPGFGFEQLEIQKYADYIKKIDIQTYSSVEGKSWFNERIQAERAKNIEAFFTFINITDKSLFKTHANENWDKFDEQVIALNLTEFKDLSKAEVKRYLKLKNTNGKYDSLLYEQRKSVARIKIKGKVTGFNDSSNVGLIWEDILAQKNIPLAAKFLQSNYPHALSNELFFGSPFDSIYFDNKAFACNYMANKIANKFYRFNADLKSIELMALDFSDKTNLYYALNWMNIYYWDLYYISRQYFDNPEKRMPTISPEKVLEKLQSVPDTVFTDTTYLSRLKLNHCLSSIHYFVWNNEWSKVNYYFDLIFDYFYTANLTITEATDLALYTNYFHRYDRSVKLLDLYYNKSELDENAAFVLAQTATLIQGELEEQTYLGYMKKALEFNKARWCGWINGNFQVMRNETVKTIYCNVCP